MKSPISPRAIAYVRKNATAVMQYRCRIERIAPGEMDEDDLEYHPGASTVIYEGVCRLWEVTGEQSLTVIEGDVIMQGTNLSIPWDTQVLPKRNDEVQILSAPSDPAVVGKRYQIQDSAKAGEMRATRRFSVIALERS